MEVKAILQGYYDMKIRPEGTVFTIKSEKDFSSKWMVRLDGKPVKDLKADKKAGAKKEEIPPSPPAEDLTIVPDAEPASSSDADVI